MSNAFQPKATLASDGPQAAKSQPDQKECKITTEELEALFKAAREDLKERRSKMTDEEKMKEPSWRTVPGVSPAEAMRVLEEIEASNAGSDDEEDATGIGSRKASTKHKDSKDTTA